MCIVFFLFLKKNYTHWIVIMLTKKAPLSEAFVYEFFPFILQLAICSP